MLERGVKSSYYANLSVALIALLGDILKHLAVESENGRLDRERGLNTYR